MTPSMLPPGVPTTTKLLAAGLMSIRPRLLPASRCPLVWLPQSPYVALTPASESGVNVRRIKVGNFVLCSTLAALAGILESVRITSIQALQGGTQLMFYAVAAAVIGGTSLFGGSGTIIGAAIGVLVLAVLNLGFTLQGINAYTFDLVLGIAIIASMAFNVTLERIRQSGRLGTSR